MNRETIQIAINKAKQSPSKYRVSAMALDKQGKILATAINRPRFDRHGGGVHAELAVLKKTKTRHVKSIIICRVGATGELLPIDSCHRCRRVLDRLGIKVYSIQ